ncbi:isoprenoid biosynthesis glyoxalase ElbB [Myxococcota bacterium]|nr:isoprenoid biosynthesis glyoxalase ElbB [Myxococcota bacterium]
MKVGVVLSGCGVFDGAEIHESVLTLLELDRAGAEAVIAAPDAEQMHVVDHVTGQPVPGERRNVLVESARIARGRIRDLATLRADEVDALIFPGGFGVAKNLCNYAERGADHAVHPEVERIVREAHQARKPIAFLCIAPALAARLLPGSRLTIGADPRTADDIRAMGCEHVECGVREFVVDEERRVVTTPAYMLGPGIKEVAEGIGKTVEALLRMAG